MGGLCRHNNHPDDCPYCKDAKYSGESSATLKRIRELEKRVGELEIKNKKLEERMEREEED